MIQMDMQGRHNNLEKVVRHREILMGTGMEKTKISKDAL